jgi:hypothetical protein
MSIGSERGCNGDIGRGENGHWRGAVAVIGTAWWSSGMGAARRDSEWGRSEARECEEGGRVRRLRLGTWGVRLIFTGRG